MHLYRLAPDEKATSLGKNMMPWKHCIHKLKGTNEGEGVNNTLGEQILEGPRENLCPHLSTK